MSSKKHKTPVIRFKGFTDAWEQRKLIEEADFFDEKRIPIDSEKRVQGRYPYYGATGVIDYVDNYIFDGEYILLAEDGANIITRNSPVAYITEGKFWLNNHAHIMKMKLGSNLFLLQLLERQNYEKFNSGTAQPKLNGQIVKNMIFNFPSYKEQNKIGNFFKLIDDAIALHQRQLGNYKELKKAMLQKMFPRDGESVPEVRFAGFTESWEQRKFKELFCERREKTVFENEDTLLSCAIEGMFLNTELFSHFRGSSNIGYLKVKKNDLILSAQNLHIGNANVNLRFEHGIISPAYKVYDLINSNPLFIQAWVKKDATKNFFLSATTEGASGCRKNVEWKVLNEQVIAVPNMEEQNKIGEFFKQLDETIALHQQKGTDYQQLKKTMLQQMFV